GAVEDHHVLEQVYPLDAVAAQLRGPQEVLQVPARPREVPVLESPTGLEDGDPVPLLRETKGGAGSAETGADDQDVGVDRRLQLRSVAHLMPIAFIARRPVESTRA